MARSEEYFAIDSFDLDRGFLANPLMAAIKLARFKFVAKMLSPQDRVLDIGCGQGVGSYFYSRFASKVTGLDLYADQERAAARFRADNLSFVSGDILAPPPPIVDNRYDAITCVDVIEHFHQPDGERIIALYRDLLSEGGMMILGTPSRLSQAYRSASSRDSHFYEYEPMELRALCDRHFKRTLLFSMNDEVVHTGFDKLAWFFFVLCFR